MHLHTHDAAFFSCYRMLTKSCVMVRNGGCDRVVLVQCSSALCSFASCFSAMCVLLRLLCASPLYVCFSALCVFPRVMLPPPALLLCFRFFCLVLLYHVRAPPLCVLLRFVYASPPCACAPASCSSASCSSVLCFRLVQCSSTLCSSASCFSALCVIFRFVCAFLPRVCSSASSFHLVRAPPFCAPPLHLLCQKLY